MTDFDPYLKWLGIRDPQRPVNHYRLLGLDLFESDVDVISTAADRQMAHVRTYQSGNRAELSQKILSELAIARRCLLVPEQKQAYDDELRQSMTTEESIPAASPVVSVKVAEEPAVQAPNFATSSVAVSADASMREKRKKREQSQLVLGMVGWIGGGLAAVGVCAALIYFGVIPGFGKKNNKVAAIDPIKEDPGKSNIKSPSDKDGQQNRKPPRNNNNHPRNNNNSTNNNQNTGGNPANPNKNVVNDPRHADFPWTRQNLNRYPPPGPSARRLLSLAGDAVKKDQIHRLGISNPTDGNAEFQLLSGNHLLVGLALSQANDGSIKSFSPLQRGLNGIRIGQEYGRHRSSTRTFLLAKPGYAVGAIEVSTERPMKCIRLIYMKILDDRLDTKDQYASDWFPKQVRPITRIRNSVGLPLVGAFGRYRQSSNIETLGLIGAITHNALGIVSVEGPLSLKNDPFRPDKNPGDDPSANTSAKVPPPSVGEIETARDEILTLYQRRFRDATVNEAIASRNESARRNELLRARGEATKLARELLNDAKREAEASPSQFTLFREAATIGSQVGDLEIVSEAMQGMDTYYQIDFWKLMDEAVKKTAKNTVDSDVFRFRKSLDDLIDQSIEAKKFKEGEKLADWAFTQVKKTNPNQAEKYRELGRKIGSLRKAQVASDRAWKALDDDPNDPKAHEDIGMFEFMGNKDIDAAIEHWAKSENEELLEIAKVSKDADFEDSTSLVTVATAWNKAGKSNRTYQDKMFLEQAKELLTKATVKAEGLERRRIQKMLDDLYKEINK